MTDKHFIAARKWGDRIFHRWVDHFGIQEEEVQYKPVLYVRDESKRTPSGWTDPTGKLSVGPVKTSSMKEAKEAAESYSSAGILYGQPNFELQFLSDRYPDIKPGLHPLCKIAAVDIEVDSSQGFPDPLKALWEIDSITHYDSVDDKFYVFSLCEWNAADSHVPHLAAKVVYKHFTRERDMLRAYLAFWKANCPAIVTGWNLAGFDIPYIYNRCVSVFSKAEVEAALSPFSVIQTKEDEDKYGNDRLVVDIFGVITLDLLDLYRKFTFKARENYKLGFIGMVELGEDKLDFGDATSHSDLKKTDPQRYVDYNIKDVDLVLRIDQKRKLIDLAAFIAQTAKVNFPDVFSPVKTWDALICNHLLKTKRVAMVNTPSHKKEYEGAFVKVVKPGLSRWIASFDVASLYPSIIMQWNMCPSTISSQDSVPYGDYVEQMMQKQFEVQDGVTIAANGVAFETTKTGVLPELVKILFTQRKSVKSEMIALKKQKQLVVKELLDRGIEVNTDD